MKRTVMVRINEEDLPDGRYRLVGDVWDADSVRSAQHGEGGDIWEYVVDVPPDDQLTRDLQELADYADTSVWEMTHGAGPDCQPTDDTKHMARSAQAAAARVRAAAGLEEA